MLNNNVSDAIKIKAMEKASKILGKKRDDSLHVTNPTSKCSWFMQTIKTIIATSDKVIFPYKYIFENTRDAAKFNTGLLKKYKYNFTQALDEEQGTMLEPGSEFRSSTTLQSLFEDHEHWDKMRDIISNGVSYPLEDLPEQTRKEDLEFIIRCGNHKSALSKENEEKLLENYAKEVKHGWMMLVTIECVTKIDDASVIPVGVATQFSIDEKGNRKTKRRTTHDASFPPPSQ